MKKYIILSLLAACFAVSCHKDKGNYIYLTDEVSLVISEEMRSNPKSQLLRAFVFSFGEDVVIPAKYEIKDKELTKEDLGFEWIMGGKVVSTQDTLRLSGYPTNNYDGLLIITDKRFNIKYPKLFSFQIDPSFTDGWALAVEDGSSKAYIDYLRKNVTKGGYDYVHDAYGKSNNGDFIKAGIKEISSHIFETTPYSYGLSIVQAGPEDPLDLDINSMSLRFKAKKGFLNPPASLNIKSVLYKQDYTYMLDESGDIYVKKDERVNSHLVPHSGFFPSVPVSIEGGGKISHWINSSNMSSSIVVLPGTVAYDEKNKRCVDFFQLKNRPFADTKDFYSNKVEHHKNGPGFDGKNEYPDIVYPGPENLSGYKVHKMSGCGYDADMFATPFLTAFMLLEKESDGKLYFYTFDIYYDTIYGLLDIDLGLFFPVPATLDLEPSTMIVRGNLGGPNHIVYFTAKGNKELYYFNTKSGTIRKIYTSASPITAIRQGEIQTMMGVWGEPGIYSGLFVVASRDGMVKVLKVDDSVLAGDTPKVEHSFKLEKGYAAHIDYLPNSITSY